MEGGLVLESVVALCAFSGVSASHGVYRGYHDCLQVCVPTRNEFRTFNSIVALPVNYIVA